MIGMDGTLASSFFQREMNVTILGTILIGFIVGLIARALKPGDDKLGLIMTTLLGIAGAFVARYVGMAMGLYTEGEAAGWIASVLGAVVLLAKTLSYPIESAVRGLGVAQPAALVGAIVAALVLLAQAVDELRAQDVEHRCPESRP